MQRLIQKGGTSLQEIIDDTDRIRLWLEREGDNIASGTLFLLLGQFAAWRRQFADMKDQPKVSDLAMLIARLVRQVRKNDPDNPVAAKAMDYLRRHDLRGSILREVTS